MLFFGEGSYFVRISLKYMYDVWFNRIRLLIFIFGLKCLILFMFYWFLMLFLSLLRRC